MKSALVWFALLATAACSPSTEAAGRVTRADSAGVQIIQSLHSVRADSVAWLLSAEPSLQIGTAEGDSVFEFNRIRNAVTLSDRRIAVANGEPPQVRVFDRAGTFVTAFGGPGDGPGEFRSLNWIQRIGSDTIIVLDSQHRRVSAFASDGTFAWSIDVRQGSGVPIAGPVRWADGTLLLHREESDALSRVAVGEARAGQALRSTATLVHYSSSGAELNLVVRAEGSEGSVFLQNGRPAMVPAPYGRSLVYALLNQTVLVGTQAAYEIREYSQTGSLLRVIRWSGPDLAVTPEDVQLLSSAQLERVHGDPGAAKRVAQFFAELPFPPSKAAYGRILIDASGNLWVSSRAMPPEPPKSWMVFSNDHEMLGEVLMPDRFDLYEVGRDFALGRWRDEVGVEYIRRYELVRPE